MIRKAAVVAGVSRQGGSRFVPPVAAKVMYGALYKALFLIIEYGPLCLLEAIRILGIKGGFKNAYEAFPVET